MSVGLFDKLGVARVGEVGNESNASGEIEIDIWSRNKR